MGRPSTKSELVEASREQYQALQSLLDTLTPAQLHGEFAFEDRDRNVRDVLVHLHEWHQLLLAWVETNVHGQPQPFLPPPYTWKNYGDLNVEFWRQHQETSLEEARARLADSHQAVSDLIDRFSDTELFTKKHFAWTGTTSLGSYCVSVTSSHYDWALAKLRKHRKTSRPT